jgi:hypothetical protein
MSRRMLLRDEASARHAIASSLHTTALYQHALLAANPSLIPSTNIIEGVPLLASLYIPHDVEQAATEAKLHHNNGFLKAHHSSKRGHNGPVRTATTTDGFVVVKNAAYNAVRDTTPSLLNSSNASVTAAAAAAAVHRNPTSPPSHTPLRYPYAAAASSSSVAGAFAPGAAGTITHAPGTAGTITHAPGTAGMVDHHTFDALRQFDKAVRVQQDTARAAYSEVSLAWMPHDDISFLFQQWKEFFSKWSRRAGATPSSLLSSFLCTMLIDDDADDDRAEFLNKTVMEETLEIVCDASAVHTPSMPMDAMGSNGFGTIMLERNKEYEGASTLLNPSSAAAAVVSYNEFCYVLRNIGEAIFPVRDPLAAIQLFTTSLMDRYHRVHY